MPFAPLPFWENIVADALCHTDPQHAPLTTQAKAKFFAQVLLSSAGFRVMLIYRLGHTARKRYGGIGRFMSQLLFWFNRHWYGCAIATTARLGGGMILPPHPQGIVIGGQVVVGKRTWIFQNVTIGGGTNTAQIGMPCIGSDVRVYAGAVVTGQITVGDNVRVGANAVVSRDVATNTVVCLPEALYRRVSQS